MNKDVIKQSTMLLDKIIDEALQEFRNFLDRLSKKEETKNSKIKLLNEEYEICKRKSDEYINNSYPLDTNDTVVNLNGIDYISVHGALRFSLCVYADDREVEFIRLKNDFLQSLKN